MTQVTRRRLFHLTAGALSSVGAPPKAAQTQERLQNESPLDSVTFRSLASTITGHVITSDKSDYETARKIFNRAFDRHPALIVQCATATDVARTLEFVRNHDLPLAVRGGGHSRAGLSMCDAGVVIDLSLMNRVEVEARERIATADAGALVVHVDAATQRFGLATTLAGCPTVGIAGLTIGGGEGFLMSKYGAACDNLMSAQLVTADGRQLETSLKSHPDLFWALRGGGGNFGVITALKYRLHPLTDVLAGTLVYPVGHISDMLRKFADFVAAAPDEMNVVGQVLPSGGGPRFQMLVLHCGDSKNGNRLLAPWRLLNPQRDTIRTVSYLEANATTNPAAPAAHFQTNLFLPDLSAAAIAAIDAAARAAPPGTRVFMVPIYGAITRVTVGDTAFPLRSFGYELDIMGRWTNPTDQTRAVQWVKSLREILKPFAQGAYVNQLGETSEELVRMAYGPNYARLAAIKKKYDPSNLFRSNQNIKPA